ncbi:hypothetical protein PFISCL1PPCAC_5839 [Pristionchus fissidentatus]|uniref:Uncharacterized protein n=1 Tax=Pristionchus fissidentatus TaxID=1538716 RepID=A0AAV5V4M2_9BILA|nr:hypothetical protein PFISCL1PPCAC_5839 [Pristionchus fissidentatus]
MLIIRISHICFTSTTRSIDPVYPINHLVNCRFIRPICSVFSRFPIWVLHQYRTRLPPIQLYRSDWRSTVCDGYGRVWQESILKCSGNVFSVPIIEGIGVGLGMLIWGTIQVLVGWGVARFGLFDLLLPSPTEHDVLNYIGLAITLICGICFVFVRHNKENEEEEKKESENSIEMDEVDSPKAEEKVKEPESTKASVLRKIPYLLMAGCLGVLHGLMMSPVDIAKQNTPAEVKQDKYFMFDFVFSYFSTVFAFSTLYFIAYCVIRRGKAHVKAELVVPSVFYGILWSIGMTLWFLSADRLAQTVAYPITTRLPAIIGALIDVFFYRSIQGRKNIIYFGFVILLGIIGVVLIALSNTKF